ncbi:MULTISPECIES: hypothetical protein [Burkholderia]|uniref:hypothetical protein n=1 Tax=Burkholderia dolosa TaxID=152500 RepID=UPI000454E156|nr:hypothetical protein [Burkholderia dolosa]ETP63806.1 hypothetical protein BDSB_22730 [Burkholderia dolosa PC543]
MAADVAPAPNAMPASITELELSTVAPTPSATARVVLFDVFASAPTATPLFCCK